MLEELIVCRVCGLQKPIKEFYVSKGSTNKICKQCRKDQYLERTEKIVSRRNGKDGMCRRCGEYPAMYGSYCKSCNRELSKERMKKRKG